jgi:hypothetical protein
LLSSLEMLETLEAGEAERERLTSGRGRLSVCSGGSEGLEEVVAAASEVLDIVIAISVEVMMWCVH